MRYSVSITPSDGIFCNHACLFIASFAAVSNFLYCGHRPLVSIRVGYLFLHNSQDDSCCASNGVRFVEQPANSEGNAIKDRGVDCSGFLLPYLLSNGVPNESLSTAELNLIGRHWKTTKSPQEV